MADNNKISSNRRKLYDVLTQHISNLGTFDEFNSRMVNESNRRKVYNIAQEYISNTGTWDEFTSLVAPRSPMDAIGDVMKSVRPTVNTDTAAMAEPQRDGYHDAAGHYIPGDGDWKKATAPTAAAPKKKEAPTAVPSEADKIRLAHDLYFGNGDFAGQKSASERMGASVEAARRTTESATPEGRRMTADAEGSARMAGAPTRLAGISAGPAWRGGDLIPQGGQEEASAAASPKVHGVRYVGGKAVTEWLMPDGSLTTDLREADAAERTARLDRQRHKFAGRMAENGLDPEKAEDVQLQEQMDMQAPIYRHVAELWNEAEARHKADMDKSSGEHWDSYAAMGGGREMRTVTAAMDSHDREKSHLTRFDLQTMMEHTWNRLGKSGRKQLIDRSLDVLSRQNPAVDKGELIDAAKKMARSLSDNAVYQYAVSKNMPESTLEYFGRQVADMNLVNSIGKGLARIGADGKTGDLPAYEAAMGEYGKDHRVAQIGGTVLGMAVDPTMWVSGGVGSLGARTAVNAGGRIVAQRAANGMTRQVGQRLFSSSLGGRIITGAAGGASNFATYEMLKEGERQFVYGGVLNPEALEVGGYSAGDVLKAGAHGLVMGGVTGTFSPLIGNVADKTVKATTSTTGKAGVRLGEVAVSALAEGTVFSIPEWISGEGDAFDVWTDNMAMMIGFKAQHGLKSAPRVIAGLRPIKEPKTRAERNHNRQSFVERLRNSLDASQAVLSVSKDEREELRRAGYGELADLFGKDKTREVRDQSDEVRAEDGIIEVRAERVEAEEIADPDRKAEFDGYSAMERLMEDGRVSEATRAKMYYILTGQMLPMSSVVGWNSTANEQDGTITVSSINAHGGVVTSRTFKNQREADAEMGRIQRQAELNTVDIGEQYREAEADGKVFEAAVNAVSPGADHAAVKEIYDKVKRGDEDATEQQRVLAQMLDEAIDRNKDAGKTSRPETMRSEIKKETGVDVDTVLRKQPKDRSKEEQDALQTYMERLYPEEARRQPGEKEESATRPEEEFAEYIGDGGKPAGPGLNPDGTPMNPVGRATMKVDDRKVEVLGGRIVMTDDGAMVDSSASDKSIIIRDVATGKVEMVSPDAILTYEDAPADAPAQYGDSAPMEYGAGRIVLRGEDGTEKRGYLTGGIVTEENYDDMGVSPSDIGKYEYYVEGGLDGLHYATREELDGMVVDFTPEEPAEGPAPDTAENASVVAEDAAADAETAPQTPVSEEGAIVDAGTASEEPVSEEVAQHEHPQSALERLPKDEKGNPVFEQAESPEHGWDALVEYSGGDEAAARDVADMMSEEKRKEFEKAQKLKSKGKTPAEILASRRSNAAALAHAQAEYEHWQRIAGVHDARQAEIRRQEEARRQAEQAAAHDEAVARFEQEQRAKAEKQAEQEAVGTHAVNPRIKERWNAAPKVEGHADAITLPDGSVMRGRYVLTEAGAASASHDVANAYAPTEGFPVDENGQSVNDRDYQRDMDAQRIVERMAGAYDNRALQSPVVVSKDGVVLSGNNRTMSGDLAARQGTDAAYVDYLREFGAKYGFSPRQVEGMRSPRIVFVPDEALPYDAATFARFNAQEMKSQSKPEMAVKLGKVVPEGVFAGIVNDISRHDRLGDYYADEKAVAHALGALMQAGVINDRQMPEMRTGTAISPQGKEMIENTLIGKIFQANPDAVRQVISTPAMRQPTVMALSEIAANRTLADAGYDLADELARAVDLVYRAKSAQPDVFKEGVPVSPFGRMQGLFDDEFGNSRLADAVALHIADVLNSGRPGDLRRLLAAYNNEAQKAAGGQMDIFTGEVPSKEELLKQIKDQFTNATPGELQAIVDRAIAERKQRAEAAGQTDYDAESGQTGATGEGGRGNVQPADERQGDLQQEKAEESSDRGAGVEDDSAAAGGRNTDVRGGNTDDAANGELAEGVTPSVGPFGEIYTQFKGKPQEAVTFLLAKRSGEAIGALHHKEIGDIDLVWGKEGTAHSDGYGLAKLAKFHPEVLFNLQEVLNDMVVTKRSTNRVQLESDKYQAAVRLTWDDKKKTWLLTMFEKKNSVPDNTTDTVETLSSNGNDTATPENTVISSETATKTEPQQPNNAVSSDSSLPTDEQSGTSSIEPNGESAVSIGKVNALSADKQEGGGESSIERGDIYISKRTGVLGYVEFIEDDGRFRVRAQDGGLSNKLRREEIEEIWRPATEEEVNASKWGTQRRNEYKSETEKSIQAGVETASAEVEQNPTEAQKEAGNYKKDHVTIGDFDITIENPAGSVRSGVDASGNRWQTTMANAYGYIKGTESVDGDHIDVFLHTDMDEWNGRKVYVVDQTREDGAFDEHKVMLGFNDGYEAMQAYLANYDATWAEKHPGLRISEANIDDFNKWIQSSHRKTKPFADYANVDKQIFAPDYDPMAQPQVRSAEDVAAFLNSHRMGDRAKISFLILSRANKIVGNIHTPYTNIPTDAEEMAHYISERVIQFGGENAILYGDFAIDHSESSTFNNLKHSLQRVGGTNLLDVVNVEGNYTRSANNEGLLYEPDSEYGASTNSDIRFREVEDDKVLTESAHQQEMAQTSPEAKRGHAEKLSKKFNTPIRIVEDAAELTHDDPEMQKRMRGSKGFYNPATGEVVVVVPNNVTVEDVAGTVFHEVVAHKGLRELVGEENYDNFCDEVYGHLKDDLKRQVDEETTRRFINDPGQGYERHRRVSVDEMFGRMSEKGFEDFTEAERGIWAKLKAKVLEAINKFLGSLKLPKWVKLGDNELRYMLWRSHERLRSKGDYVDMARDAAKRSELGLNNNIMRREGKEERELHMVNERFNEQLGQLISGESKGGELQLGKPGRILRSAGIGGSKIVLDCDILRKKMSESYKHDHPFDYEDVRDLPMSINAPIAVFESKGHGDFNILVDLSRDGKNFIVSLKAKAKATRKGEIIVEEIVTLYPKGEKGVVSWINAGLGKVYDKEKALEWLTRREPHAHKYTAQELDDAAKVINNFENPKMETPENGILFRGGETDDIWSDRSVGLEERITNAAIRLAGNQAGDLILRNDAMRAVTNNLQSLLRTMRNSRGRTTKFKGADRKVESKVVDAMNAQAMYDRSTVKRVTDLARILIQHGYLSGMTGGEVKRLLSAVKDATAMHNPGEYVEKILDIMVDNQLRNGEGALRSLLAIRGSKVDARGVEVQGELDVEGQRTMEVAKEAMSLTEDKIHENIAEALNRMSDPDQTIADQAVIKYAGLNMALDYVQNIADSKAEEKTLRDSLKTVKEDRDAGRMTDDAYRQFVETTEDAIRKNKIERAEAYFNLVGRLSDSLRGSMENAKVFREAEKARVREIHHNANSDMEGRPANEHHRDGRLDKFMNNGFVQFMFAPLATFDQMLRVFGNKSANGEGYLWNRFMRGWVDCRERELLGVKDKLARLDAKAAEVFGKGVTWGKLIRLSGKMKGATVSFQDGGEMREHKLTQGNLMYVYMVDKMSDGRMKLRRMGITESDVADIESVLDPRFRQLADWLQEEFLVDTRNEYNETHKRMFGASMAAIENYFPLKILANARIDREEDVNQPNRPDGITTKTGSIIKRRANNLALDITGADALSVILDHITQMEHWNAYAEWNRDLNTLRTYKRFRNQVINMTTVYGGGRQLWSNFNNLCLMAAGEYRPPVSKLNKNAANIAKGVTAAKVSLRMFTALKQLLSAPAYAPEVSISSIAKSITHPYGDFKWCMENLPIFRERWHSRISGDPRLLKPEMDWNMWRNRIMEKASRFGMTPNAFVDAVTVAIGARAIYDTRLAQYKKEGYPEDMADKRAKQDATILFNQTQQSSESPFLSTMQVDRDWLSSLFTVFRNSAMSYTRQEFDALRNLKHNLTPGQRAESVAFMKKQIIRDWGIDPDHATADEHAKAEDAAKRRFRRQLRKDIIRLATFGFILELAWNLGAYLPYMFFGNDNDEKDAMWDDALTHAYFGSVEGLTGGDVMSSFGNMAVSGEWSANQLTKDMPLASDISSIRDKFIGDRNAEAFTDIFNLLIQSGIGMNPQSITDAAVAFMDACGDDPALSHEAAIFVMRVLQVPQSQLDKMYFDEIGLSGEEASKLTPEQLAERYATYKVKRGTPFAPWSWDDGERIDRYRKAAEKKIKERLENQGRRETLDAYADFEERYKAMRQKAQEAKKLMKFDYLAGAQAYAELQQDPDAELYRLFGRLDKQLKRITKMYMEASTAEEAAMALEAVTDYRAGMVEALEAETEAERQKHREELERLRDEFVKRYRETHAGPAVQ